MERSSELLPEERAQLIDTKNPHRNSTIEERGPAFHEKRIKIKKQIKVVLIFEKQKNIKADKQEEIRISINETKEIINF